MNTSDDATDELMQQIHRLVCEFEHTAHASAEYVELDQPRAVQYCVEIMNRFDYLIVEQIDVSYPSLAVGRYVE